MEAEALMSGTRQRRQHKKSRQGCSYCKKRHVKCDEQHPVCGLCKRVKKECSFASIDPDQHNSRPVDGFVLPSNASPIPSQTSLSVRIRHSPSPTSGASIENGYQSVPASLSPPHLQPLPIADLELLYNQMRYNQALGRDGDDIRLGFNFPYVLHSILSLSAFLLYSEQPSRTELLDRACRHQNSALALVRPHLLELNSGNVNAVLQFSAITSVISLAQPLYQHPYRCHRKINPINDILNSFHMTRGIKTIRERQWQMQGETFDPDVGPALDDEDPWQQDLMSRYTPYPILRDLMTVHCTSDTDRLVCLDATRKIFSFIALLEEYPNVHPDARLVQIWPIEIKTRFLNMLTARRPIALLILGYYAALMRLRSDTMWPFDAWPGLILQQIEDILGDCWLEYLEWPKSRVFSHGLTEAIVTCDTAH